MEWNEVKNQCITKLPLIMSDSEIHRVTLALGLRTDLAHDSVLKIYHEMMDDAQRLKSIQFLPLFIAGKYIAIPCHVHTQKMFDVYVSQFMIKYQPDEIVKLVPKGSFKHSNLPRILYFIDYTMHDEPMLSQFKLFIPPVYHKLVESGIQFQLEDYNGSQETQ